MVKFSSQSTRGIFDNHLCNYTKEQLFTEVKVDSGHVLATDTEVNKRYLVLHGVEQCRMFRVGQTNQIAEEIVFTCEVYAKMLYPTM